VKKGQKWELHSSALLRSTQRFHCVLRSCQPLRGGSVKSCQVRNVIVRNNFWAIMNYFNKRSAQRNANYHRNVNYHRNDNYQGDRQSMIRASLKYKIFNPAQGTTRRIITNSYKRKKMSELLSLLSSFLNETK
jgi:hypothetical protein